MNEYEDDDDVPLHALKSVVRQLRTAEQRHLQNAALSSVVCDNSSDVE
jgi:hypothetical protein